MDSVSRVPIILDKVLQQAILANNNLCCKLNTLIAASGGTGTPISAGAVKLTGSASFSTGTPRLGGMIYHSVSFSVISLTTGTVTITDGVGTIDISYPGYSGGWDNNTGLTTALTITTTGDAIVLINYTIQ